MDLGAVCNAMADPTNDLTSATSTPRLRVAAAAIIDGDVVLLARRAAHKSFGGLWEFPGGKFEPGETGPECLVREIGEELGVTITVGPHVLTSEHNTGAVVIVLETFEAELAAGVVRRSADHDALAWVALEQLSSFALTPPDVPVARALAALADV